MRDHIVPQLEGEEYLLWEARQAEKHELHHGFVLAFAGGTREHATIALNVQIGLRRAYPAPCRVFGSDVRVEISQSTFYYPDASVVCDPGGDAGTTARTPLVVVEVLSPSTRTYDLVDKRANYRTMESISTLIFIDAASRRVEIDTRAFGGWRTELVSDGRFELGETTIALDEVYAQTSLA